MDLLRADPSDWWGHWITNSEKNGEKSGLIKGQVFFLFYFIPRGESLNALWEKQLVREQRKNCAVSGMSFLQLFSGGPTVIHWKLRTQNNVNPKGQHISTKSSMAWLVSLAPLMQTLRNLSQNKHLCSYQLSCLMLLLIIPLCFLDQFHSSRHIILYPCCIYILHMLSF